MIYPVDSAIQLLNHWGQIYKKVMGELFLIDLFTPLYSRDLWPLLLLGHEIWANISTIFINVVILTSWSGVMVSSCQCLAILMFPFTRKERCILMGILTYCWEVTPKWTSIPWKGWEVKRWQYSKCFMLLKFGINYGHVGFIGLCVPLSFMLTRGSYKQGSTREGSLDNS